MEDSYTVHRRRKAAARRREKTPEPPKRRQDDVTETDEDEQDARARIERMVQETEMLEAIEDNERRRASNEKNSAENIEKTKFSEDKPHQRALKRATSPELRRRDEVDTKLSVDASKREQIIEKPENEGQIVETAKSSGSVNIATLEVNKRSKDFYEETTRKLKNDDGDTTIVSHGGTTRHHRRDVEKDVSTAESTEKTASIGKKVSSSDIVKSEKNQSDNVINRSREHSRDVGDSMISRKTSSKATNEVEQAMTLDENRYEAVPRETDIEPVRSAAIRGKSLKNETSDRQDTKKAETPDEETKSRTKTREIPVARSSRQTEEKIRKNESTLPEKIRNSEIPASPTTIAKRSSKLRDNDRTLYTSDSSENEENTKILLRRKKSPEGAKLRITSGKKHSNRSRPTTDTDGDLEEQQDNERRNEKKTTIRRKPSSETDEDKSLKNRTRSPSNREKRDLSRVSSRQTENKVRIVEKRTIPRNTDVNDEDSKIQMRKSETFPLRSTDRDKSPSITRSSTEIKKQIIPLSDDSLIEDFERAQRDYMRKERSIMDHDPMDDYVDPRMEAALRRRKFSIIQTETEAVQISKEIQKPEKKSWFAWLPFFGKGTNVKKLDNEQQTEETLREKISVINDKEKVSLSSEKSEKLVNEAKIVKEETSVRSKKVSFLEFFRTLGDFASEFRAFVEQNPRETRKIRILRNRCITELLLAIIYCGLGAFVFRFTEGAFETFYKCGVKRVKRDFLDSLWNFSHNMREEDWKSMARRKLMEFEEQLHTAHEAGVHSYSGQKSWSFLNAVVYCLTVITTIGYGHISPSTTTGRAITIVYAIFGIPMFLIILADFGKLFTRGIKFLWAFVRRVYYTGSCRRVRRTVPVQEVMKGVQLVYDLATFRRPSQMNPEEIEEIEKQQNQTQTVLNLDGNAPSSAQPDTPGTPAMSTFAIDDEFNLPISVAIVILLAYIFVGATVYNFWEQWGFFESFYFVFISMSTIGFGDYVPKHPIYMMLSIVYLVFGLALTSMCINVVQVMLSDSFKQASQKIGATIGFEVTEEDGSVHPATPPTVEIADVHMTIKESESEEQVAPRAKQEDLEM